MRIMQNGLLDVFHLDPMHLRTFSSLIRLRCKECAPRRPHFVLRSPVAFIDRFIDRCVSTLMGLGRLQDLALLKPTLSRKGKARPRRDRKRAQTGPGINDRR